MGWLGRWFDNRLVSFFSVAMNNMQRIAWSKGNSTFQFHVLSVHPQWKTPPQRTRKQSFDCHFFRHSLFYFFFGGELLYIFFWCVWCPQDTIGFSARLGWSLADDECRDLPLNVWNWQLYIVWSMRHMPVKGSCLAMFLYVHDYEALWRVGIVWRIKHWYITINKTWYSFHTNSDRIITQYNHLPIMACSFPLLLTRLFGFSLGFGST